MYAHTYIHVCMQKTFDFKRKKNNYLFTCTSIGENFLNILLSIPLVHSRKITPFSRKHRVTNVPKKTCCISLTKRKKKERESIQDLSGRKCSLGVDARPSCQHLIYCPSHFNKQVESPQNACLHFK